MRVLKDWLLTADRLAVHEPTGTAVIADPHFGYAEARRKSGDAVPAAATDVELARLSQALRRASVARLIIAGDVVEECWTAVLVRELLTWSRETGIDLVAITPGNHDRGLQIVGDRLTMRPEGVLLGDWLVCHGDRGIGEAKVVHGHVHPCIPSRGRRRPCYLVSENRLVLPAFSRDAAGVNVRGDPRWSGCRHYVV